MKYEIDDDGDYPLMCAGKPSDYRQMVFFSRISDTPLTKVHVGCMPESRVPLEHYWKVLDFLGRINGSKASASWCIDASNGTITCKQAILGGERPDCRNGTGSQHSVESRHG